MLDRTWSGDALRISPEAPVPIVHFKNQEDRPGGAANVALNMARLGAQVVLVGVVGEDSEAEILRNKLEAVGILCEFIISEQQKTICKLRILSQRQQLLRIDFEEEVLKFDRVKLLDCVKRYVQSCPVVVFSDYNKGSLVDIEQSIEHAKKAGCLVLVDPKGCDYQKYAGADMITPNLSEFHAVAGSTNSETELREKARNFLKKNKIKTMLLTRREAGVTIIDSQTHESLSAKAKEVFDVTGAGDTVIATVATALGLGMSLSKATELAMRAAGIVVGKLGTATVSLAELMIHHVVSEDELVVLLESAKANKERIVMTNGCFDLLHAGHIAYLNQAKALGDRLVIAVNSDDSVRALKGPSRPINQLQDRMDLLAALKCVDWVVSFSETTPERLYRRLQPDVLVKGGDYEKGQVVGADSVLAAGGEVCILPFLPGHSTSAMIERGIL